MMALVLVGTPGVLATPTILGNFNAKYGTAGSALDTCNTCHSPALFNIVPNPVNYYGGDLFNNSLDFAKIEGKDSDGDGYTNIAEITARTFPGDPSSHPADTTPPVITIIGSNPATVNLGATYTDAGATAVDAVDGTVAVTTSGTVDTSVAGTYTITYTATDKSGNKATATRTVNVVNPTPTDTTPPVITVLGSNPATVNLGATYTDAGATATDAVDGTVAVTTSGTVDTSVVGTYTITYTATDKSGNTATAKRTVNVVNPAPTTDTIPPVITVLGSNPATVNLGATYTDAGATAVDAVDGPVAVTTSGTVDTSVAGTYTITYTATDKSGNTATATRTVNVVSVTTSPPGDDDHKENHKEDHKKDDKEDHEEDDD